MYSTKERMRMIFIIIVAGEDRRVRDINVLQLRGGTGELAKS